ncbi:transcriptional regulator NrdR [Orrella sp. 11846]|uniref:transcriptional regulator NrdR n=1 Tax=Orrella sp. 11846 TaxID=3409913 RepID=UPI003B591236
MKCPYCRHNATSVADSRETEDGEVIRRRRRCEHCDKRFTTYERAELAMPIVVKRNGVRQEYDASKLEASLKLALRKRPVSTDEIDRVVHRINEQLLVSGQREVSTETIGGLVMDELSRLDKVAYVRFASVYQSFEDIGEFIHAIQAMQTPKSGGASD